MRKKKKMKTEIFSFKPIRRGAPISWLSSENHSTIASYVNKTNYFPHDHQHCSRSNKEQWKVYRIGVKLSFYETRTNCWLTEMLQFDPPQSWKYGNIIWRHAPIVSSVGDCAYLRIMLFTRRLLRIIRIISLLGGLFSPVCSIYYLTL